MTAPLIQGWCPGARRPMRAADGLVARIRPLRSRLSPAALRGVADLAEAHGAGMVEVTSRGNLQIRGVSDAALAPLLEGLDALGLLDADPAAEGRRNITLSPWAGAEGDLVHDLLAQGLAGWQGPDLPSKFGFVVDAGPGRRRLAGISPKL